MARPLATGLKYINLDVSFFQDRKVRRLIRRNGENAPLVYIALLCTIYTEGYYIKWDGDIALDLADTTRMEEDYIKEVIDGCLEVGLLSQEMFDKHQILTSHGIQKQYQTICEQSKRKNVVNEYSLLVSSEETPRNNQNNGVSSEETPVSSEETGVNSEEMPQHIITKHIEADNNLNKHKESSSYSSSFPPYVEKSEAEKQQEKFLSYMFFQNWAAPNKELEKFIAYNNTGGRKWSKMSKAERESALILWKQEPEQPKRFGTVYLTFWQKIYEKMEELNAPHSVVINALSDCINFTEKDSTTTILCPEDVRNFIECNLQNGIREIINRYVFQPRRTNKIMYKIPL